MRRLFIGLVVAATTTLVPFWAFAGNQEVAEQIAANLRKGGQLKDFKIGVKYQDGTAWLRGRVRSQQQMKTAMKLVFQTPGVTRVVNNLSLASDDETSATTLSQRLQQPTSTVAPEKPLTSAVDKSRASRPTGLAQPLANSFIQKPAHRVAATAIRQPDSALRPIPDQATRRAPPRFSTPHRAHPVPVAYTQQTAAGVMPEAAAAAPIPAYAAPVGGGVAPARYDQPQLPNYSWPSYAAYPNYASLTYPKQYSPTAWPYIGPFYPYPQVPLGWRKVTLKWHDGWWMLDFKD